MTIEKEKDDLIELITSLLAEKGKNSSQGQEEKVADTLQGTHAKAKEDLEVSLKDVKASLHESLERESALRDQLTARTTDVSELSIYLDIQGLESTLTTEMSL